MSTTVGLGHLLLLGRDIADINQVMLVMIGIVIDRFVFGGIEDGMLMKRGL